MKQASFALLSWLVSLMLSCLVQGFLNQPPSLSRTTRTTITTTDAQTLWAKAEDEGHEHQQGNKENDPSTTAENRDASEAMLQPSPSDGVVQSPSSIRIDDGGSDLTDRFKYKVQALMGNFDPVDATHDTEQTSGNILGAMLNFPTMYMFHVVGRLVLPPDQDDVADKEGLQQVFVKQVQDTVRQGAGLRDDAEIPTTTIPRSSKFVKVSVQVVVENGRMVTEIYEKLGELPNCVMQF